MAQGVIDVASRLVRDTMHTAKQYVETIERNAGYITGMGVAYDEVGSELISETISKTAEKTPGHQLASCWVPGRRCPDLNLIPAAPGGSQQGSRVYSLVEYGKYVVFLFGQANLETDTTSSVGANATFYKVLPPGTTTTVPKKGVYTVAEPDVAGSSETDSFVVVVRPDMYIGYVGEGAADAGWKSYLAEVFA